ncbi:unnamed protein product [Prorocentrum cordatum]|uniref:Uncharacterized protein n=1 Tax=Prorocentrum cordatum TaxID=2364126 RepID=A0ABN9PJV1_9DINO|nr:unnamed protein product [Polarella glacialis]
MYLTPLWRSALRSEGARLSSPSWSSPSSRRSASTAASRASSTSSGDSSLGRNRGCFTLPLSGPLLIVYRTRHAFFVVSQDVLDAALALRAAGPTVPGRG